MIRGTRDSDEAERLELKFWGCYVQEALAGFQKLEAGQCEGVLGELVTPGRRLPAFGAPLAELLAAADWEAAAEQGRIIPNKVRNLFFCSC